jgi:hypothetical protein
MKKQFFLLGAAAILGFAACNESSTDSTTTTDSSANTTTATTSTTMTRGTEIANFSGRTFMDVKTNKPVTLRWDTSHYYYTDESGAQPYYFYDPATSDTFDYWGRRVNTYLINNNGDYTIDETRWSTDNPTSTMGDTGTSSTSSSSTSGDTKIKATDDKYKEKTDTSKLKVTDDKMKAKKK